MFVLLNAPSRIQLARLRNRWSIARLIRPQQLEKGAAGRATATIQQRFARDSTESLRCSSFEVERTLVTQYVIAFAYTCVFLVPSYILYNEVVLEKIGGHINQDRLVRLRRE